MQDYNQPNSRSCSLPRNLLQETADATDERLVLTSEEELFPDVNTCDGKIDSVPLYHLRNVFTPINDRKPSLFQTATGSSVHSGPICTIDEQTQDRSSETAASKCQAQGSKRNVMAYEESRDAKRPKHQLPLLATPSSSPFQTLRVTKARSVGNNVSLLKSAKYHDGPHGQATDSHLPQGWSTVDALTPYPTRRQEEFGNQLNNDSVVELANNSDATSRPPLPVSSLNAADDADLRDEYPLDDVLREEDMASLLNTAAKNVKETHIPPSSVTQGWDHDSRSAVEYDPTLQYSSPFSSEKPKSSQSMNMDGGPHNGEEDLLDDDVDWNAVYAITSTIPKGSSAAGPQDIVYPRPTGQSTYAEKSVEHNHHVEETIPLKPFVRPPFPEKIHDRSTVSGLSSDTLLRTCFRIGEMVNQAAHCLGHQQEAVFELFARVNYSSRESLQRRQHFQFIDLFKDQRPYPAGVLTNWRVGGQLDRQSSAFLNVSAEPKICRCICKPIRDSKTTIGLSLVVLAIRESDWMQIKWTKQILCGGPDAAN
ncbi:uncharacterized protein F4807DRAFT_32037 [Annulohypoxylon truncatum]|uniref:uncharacterized protein n=1 Tax=Annulohypoxylon truncatum TaxID=327061 RepID=UPI002007A5B6|nr:uncharacterized protein F4807DRAFT_32037 [Annulohypoxylon truncatum]KAI1211288.1 hypothetical protein F4807DRAFT_32037 [Annulohypoxylon truncatum]